MSHKNDPPDAPKHTWTFWLPAEKYGGWAWVVIDSAGRFTTVSDYGNYGYWWGAPGEGGVLQLLMDADNDYLVGKLSHGHKPEFDLDATKKELYRELADWADLEVDAEGLPVVPGYTFSHGSYVEAPAKPAEGASEDDHSDSEEGGDDAGQLNEKHEQLMDWVNEIDLCDSEFDVMRLIDDHTFGPSTDIEELYHCLTYTPNRQCIAFVEHVMPRLREKIAAVQAALTVESSPKGEVDVEHRS